MLKLCNKLKIHYAWLILFACCCFFGSAMGILIFGTPFSLLISLLFDKTGGYTYIFLMFAVIEAVCVLLVLKMFPRKPAQIEKKAP